MARRTIDPAVKAAVLLALQNPEANKVEIARVNGLSLPTLYNWIKAAKAVEVASEAPAA